MLGITSKRRLINFLIQRYPGAAVELGLIAGAEAEVKFGVDRDIDIATAPTTLWSPGGLYPFQSGEFSLEALSDDANDTALGTGTRKVLVTGLAGDNWDATIDVITLDGETPALSAITNWRRVWRAWGYSSGSSKTNAGVITARVAGGGDTQVSIEAGAGQSQVCVTTVPGGCQGEISGIGANILASVSGTEVEIGLFTRENLNGDEPFRLRHPLGLVGHGSSAQDRTFRYPIQVPEKTDIELRVVKTTNNNTSVSGHLDFLAARL